MNITDIKNIINDLIRYKDVSRTYWLPLKKENDKTWALVLAWRDGFDKNEKLNDYQFGEYRICGKVAYNDSYMKDYDIDWIMPYDEETGEVNDTECSIESEDDINSAVSYWEKCWNEMQI